ncbi:MAG TPA: choice-of-anchor D domain-containing protein, partial [Acidobacteriaceae bacterium]|nr:choice-of-anchor D domain-containing protein [Acidobacteriaceae bacterium]
MAFAVCLTSIGCGVTVAGGTSKTAAVGALSLSTSSVSFGSVSVGNSAADTVVMTNTGSAPLQVSQIQVSGASFSVVGSANAPMTLAAGASSTLTVAFTPKSAGTVSGSLS